MNSHAPVQRLNPYLVMLIEGRAVFNQSAIHTLTQSCSTACLLVRGHDRHGPSTRKVKHCLPGLSER
eukprot:3680676-Amphidinium_carterae.1